MLRTLVSALLILNCGWVLAAAKPELKTGATAPDFSLMGSDGKVYKLSQFKGKTVVLEWFNKDCPYVHKFYDSKTMQALQKAAVAKGDVWLTIASSAEGKEGFLDVAAATKVHDEKGMMSTALLLDSKDVAASLFRAKTTPHMFVIDKVGKIAYQGAIDDQPSADKASLKGAQNYVSLALAAVDKGEEVKVKSKEPYGCSVKY